MTSYPRLILQLTATFGFAAMLSVAAPVMAAESAVTVSETVAKTAPSMVKHRATRVRLAASNKHRHINLVRSDLGCSGVWCGRQFVLMIGVGY